LSSYFNSFQSFPFPPLVSGIEFPKEVFWSLHDGNANIEYLPPTVKHSSDKISMNLYIHTSMERECLTLEIYPNDLTSSGVFSVDCWAFFIIAIPDEPRETQKLMFLRWIEDSAIIKPESGLYTQIVAQHTTPPKAQSPSYD